MVILAVMFKRLSSISLYFFVGLVFTSCSSMQFQDLFSGYAKQMKKVRQAQQHGDFTGAQALLIHREKGDNVYALTLLERARLQYLLGDWQKSQHDFSLVYQSLTAEREKAKLQISKGLKQMGAIVSNDNAIAYELPTYEQSMMHSYQALNYVNLGDLEGALVEIRRANLMQEQALQNNQMLVDDAESKFNNHALKSAYPSMDLIIGDLKNGFQNAYTFYLSGILYEAIGQVNDAYIDYKKALEIYPDNHYVQKDVLRLAAKLAMSDDLAHFTKLYGELKSTKEKDVGQVILLIEQGMINAKDDLSVYLPIFYFYNDARYFSFSLPVYRDETMIYQQAKLTVNGHEYQAEEIIKLQSLASKHLSDQLPGLVTRQAVRVIAKEQLRNQLSHKGGDIGNILANLYNMASEQADTRSWLTLPNNVQIVRVTLPIGKQQISLTVAGKTQLIDVDINKDRLSLVNVTSLGDTLNYHVNKL
ncbi:MAG: hypothetical protein ACI9LM_002109 [Alteromonadaceae bacterium]|jgi:hypothetical protein